MSVGNFCRVDNIGLRSTGHSKSDIIKEGVIKKNWLLIYIADKVTQLFNFQITQVVSIDGYSARGSLIKAGKQIDQCGFATTGTADKCHGGSLFDLQRDLF